MKIITLNLNGIRSAARKGLFQWMTRTRADAVCVQELKAHDVDLDDIMRAPGRFRGHFYHAEKKGYSGVGLYSARVPDRVTQGIGNKEADGEGRYVRADFGKLSVISVYLPSGSAGPHRQASKFRFIAHREFDLRNWRSNQKNSGFLPEERAWLTRVFDELGWVDVYRRLHPEATGEAYTWWSNRGNAYANNVGWRIDYQIATPKLAASAKRASVYKDQRFSDHAPLTIDYDYPLG